MFTYKSTGHYDPWLQRRHLYCREKLISDTVKLLVYSQDFIKMMSRWRYELYSLSPSWIYDCYSCHAIPVSCGLLWKFRNRQFKIAARGLHVARHISQIMHDVRPKMSWFGKLWIVNACQIAACVCVYLCIIFQLKWKVCNWNSHICMCLWENRGTKRLS